MKAICMVAHPDDCVIFAYQFIMEHADWDWKICYLTYNRTDPRGAEVADFWERRNIQTMFAGLPDAWEYVERGEIGFDTEPAEKWIRAVCDGTDIILTHNKKGEYGHPHHIFINQVMKFIRIPKIYFGNYPEYYNQLIYTPTLPFDPSELPLHEEVIRGFDLKSWKYFITPEAQTLL
jgi:LmbE family N-acetylglucosaminyl deacetylase